MEEVKPKLCRVCLKSNGVKFMSLFEKLGEAQICEHVMSVALVKILPGDGLPDAICPPCLLKLEETIAFKNACEESDRILRVSENQTEEIEVTIKLETETKAIVKEYMEDNGGHIYDEYSNQVSAEYKSALNPKPTPAKGQQFSPQCNECDQYFRSKCKLRVHWKKVHWHTTYRCCDNCNRIFKSKIAYDRHKKQMKCSDIIKNADKLVVLGTGKERIFQCKSCKFKTKSYQNMAYHFIVHTPGVKPFQCNICSKTFAHFGSLNVHKVSKHDTSRQPTCYICGKTMISNNAMCKHLKRHQAISVKCEVCNKSFKNSLTLGMHMVRHTNTKSYHCDKCPATFYTSPELINHKKIHQKIKCSFCTFECVNKISMSKHELKHGGELISCVECGRFYESTKHLVKHLQTYHRPKVFECSVCPKAFRRPYKLKVHVKTKHNAIFQNLQEPKTFQRPVYSTYSIRSNLSLDIMEDKHDQFLQNNGKTSAIAKSEEPSEYVDVQVDKPHIHDIIRT